jgi:hypothetical protein
MTRFKKHEDVQDVLMVQSNRIVRKPNGEVIVDLHGIHKKNEVWFAKDRDENGDLRLDLFSDIVSSCASAFLVRYIFDLDLLVYQVLLIVINLYLLKVLVFLF